MSRLIRLAIVDDASRYSYGLEVSVSRLLDKAQTGQTLIYLPKSRLLGKPTVSKLSFSDSKKNWSSFQYPFQIFHEAIVDRINVVHIQLELNTFGHPLTLLWLPMLLFNLRIAKITVLITLHSVFPRSSVVPNITNQFIQRIGSTFLFSIAMTFFYHLLAKFSDGVVVHSGTFREWLINYKIDGKKVYVIPHGVATDSANVDLKRIQYWLEKTGKKRVVLCFGVLSPRKGLETLIRAFQVLNSKQPNTVLVIAGYEPVYYRGYKNKLQTLTGDLHIENNVLFTGSVSESDIESLFTISEVVVLPYTYSISASGPLAIALQHAKPIVATNTIYFNNELANGTNCLLAQNGNPSEIASLMDDLLTNEALKCHLRCGAKSLAYQNSWENIAEMTINVYKNLLKMRHT